jgi:branched-chain amino acid transport system substrate-binding protein
MSWISVKVNHKCLIVAVLSLLLAACGTSAPATGGDTAPAAGSATGGDPIPVGWVGALSGTNAVLGKWDTYGIKLAFDEKNAAGGVCGRQLSLLEQDDGADPTKAVNASQKLISESSIVAGFATTNSTSAIAVIPIYERAKVPHFTGGLSIDITAKNSAYVFRTTAAGPAYENTLVDYLVKVKGFKSFAIIADTAAYGKGEGDYQTAAIERNGATLTTRESYNPDDKDFTGQINNIIKGNPDVLLFGGSEVASGLIAKQARQLGFKGQLAGGAAIGTPKYIETAGSDIAEGTIFTSAYITNDKNDKTKAFAAAYKAKWNEDAESHGAKAYDGAQLMIAAMEKSCANLTGEEIAKQIHAIQGMEGLQGSLTVQQNGETMDQTDVGIIKGSQLTPVG